MYNLGDLTSTGTAAKSSVGGVVGFNTMNVVNSYNMGTIKMDGSGDNYVGGLSGDNSGSGASIQKSYNTGSLSLTGTGAKNYAGGLLGRNDGGSLLNTYNWGAVVNKSTGTESYTGGLVGYNGDSSANGSISSSYNAGLVSGGGLVGGLIGSNSTTGKITNAYWDMNTSGQSAGTGSGYSDGMSGKNTAYLLEKASNYNTWDFSTTWGIIEGSSYPYFTWNYASTPQVVSGMLDAYTYTNGATVPTASLAVNGSIKQTISTGANGFYQFLLPTNTVQDGNAVLAYAKDYGNGANSVYLNAGSNPSITGLNLYSGDVRVTGGVEGSTLNLAGLLTAAKGSLVDNVLYTLDGTTGAVNVGNGSLVTSTPASVLLDKAITVRNNLFLTVTAAGGLLTIDAPVTRLSSSHTFALTADRMNITAQVDQGQTNATWAKVSPYTAGWGIVLGSTSDVAANALELSAAEYAKIGIVTGDSGAQGRNLQIGDSSTGAITITDSLANKSIDHRYLSSLYLKNNATITQTDWGNRSPIPRCAE